MIRTRVICIGASLFVALALGTTVAAQEVEASPEESAEAVEAAASHGDQPIDAAATDPTTAAAAPPPIPRPASIQAPGRSPAMASPPASAAHGWSSSVTPSAPEPAENRRTEGPHPRETVRRDVSRDRFLHGFRLGYMFIANANAPFERDQPDGESFRQHYDLHSAHHFIFGYEATWRMIGHDWLNVVLVGNVLVAGVEQSRFFPSMNGLLGFEVEETFQLGVGVNLAPTRERAAHMVAAAGWTPQVGGFYVPVHFFFVPDVHGHHRFGLTTGVSW